MDEITKIKEKHFNRVARYKELFESGEINRFAYDELIKLSFELKIEEEAGYWAGVHSGN